ncbi:MAG: HAD-IIIA family hydrolase [Desulfovibrionaceae bacterium]|nr:HAD-IIIA family hydrolase [Desulfovibrionaceae bacterium]
MDPGRPRAFVLAGGLGTRLAAVLPDRPKVLAEVAGRPFIFYLLDRLAAAGIGRAVLCTGHLAADVERAVGRVYPGLAVDYSREDRPLGTAGALSLALSRFDGDPVLVLNGDSLTDAHLAGFLAWFREQGADAAMLLVRVEDCSRFGRVLTEASGAVASFEEKGGASGPGWINAGVYLFRRAFLERVLPQGPCSLELDVFPRLAGRGLLGFLSQARFLDMGTPESLARAGEFVRGLSSGAAAVFLDRDGTVIQERHYLRDPDQVELIPGAARALERLKALGLKLVLVSNQSGVGRGYFSTRDVDAVHERLRAILAREGVELDGIFFCPHAPDEGCGCRKPAPGMALRAAESLGLDLGQSFVVGDKACDVDLGRAVGATAILVRTGYGAGHEALCRPEHVADDLPGAAGIIEEIIRERQG